jgi:GT2 family glycosyltransferase
MIKVATVIVNWNRPDLTIQTIDSLKKIKDTGLDHRIFLVDNGSSPTNLQPLEEKYRNQLDLIKLPQNLGFTGGNNEGIKKALAWGADWVLLLNNDVLVKDDFLKKLLLAASKKPKAGLLSPLIYFAPGHEFHQKRYTKEEQGRVIWYAGGLMDWANCLASHRGVDEIDHGQYKKVESTDFNTGCCLLIKRKLLEKIGLLDDKYYLYYEDNDFSQRAKKAGFMTYFVPQSKIWHLNSGSSSSGGNLQAYFITRNRLLFAQKYAPTRTNRALLKESLKKLLTGSPWERRAIIDYHLKRFGKGSWR